MTQQEQLKVIDKMNLYDDLEEAAENFANEVEKKVASPQNPCFEEATLHHLRFGFVQGAKWQKKKDEASIEGHKVYKKGKEAGMRYMKQLMMKDSIEQDVDSIWANPINTIERLGLHNLKGKVKLIIIKED